MEIVFLKTGPFALHPVYGPVVNCVAGEKASLPDDHAQQLLAYKWACKEGAPIVPPPPPSSICSEIDTDDDNCDEPYPPWLKQEWDEKAKDAKDHLEAFAKDAYGANIDRRKSVANIIAEIKSIEG